MIVFSRVKEADAISAFRWFQAFAAGNDAIFKRDPDWFARTVIEGAVWSASEDGTTLGLVYTYFDASERAWELGGLMVSEDASGRGIGLALMRIALAHMLFEHDPYSQEGTKVIAHVLRSNQAPRGIIEKMSFRHSKDIKEHGSKLSGLKAEADGYVYGDEFELEVPVGLSALAEWLNGWDGSLKGEDRGEIRTSREGVNHCTWGEAISAMAADLEKSRR